MEKLKVIIVGIGEIGRIATASLQECYNVVLVDAEKKAKPLHEIIERERGLTITNTIEPYLNCIAHESDYLKKKAKKPYFKKGKLKYK